MTLISTSQHQDSPLSRSKSGARFSLRKRAVCNDPGTVNLSSYNSDFLDGLFADVAKVNVLNELGIHEKRGSEVISLDETEGDQLSDAGRNKRTRLSLARCHNRVRASCANLIQLRDDALLSPKGITEFFKDSHGNSKAGAKDLARQDSLAYQLNCVSSYQASSESSNITDIGKIAFPHLPATVSDSSCASGLTRAKLDRQVSDPENQIKEFFGWFVDLEGDASVTPEPALGPAKVSSNDLAFQAATAPKAVYDDAELEWAKAADTVDDVLGDFF